MPCALEGLAFANPHCSKVATQKELLNSLASEADIRVELERARQKEHFEAGAKKQALVDALKVSASNLCMLHGGTTCSAGKSLQGADRSSISGMRALTFVRSPCM